MVNGKQTLSQKLNLKEKLQYSPNFLISTLQKGASLLEVLVSIIILAIGMLGIASMLLVSNQANNSNYMKQQATQTIYNIFEKIRANRQAAAKGHYNVTNIGGNGVPMTVNSPMTHCSGAACTPTQLASYDTWSWFTTDLAKLPYGCGSITTVPAANAGPTLVTVTVQWDDSPAQASLGATSETSAANADFVQISIQSQI